MGDGKGKGKAGRKAGEPTERELEVAAEYDVKTTVEAVLDRPGLYLGPAARGPLPRGYAVWDEAAGGFARPGEGPEWESVPCVVHAADEILVNALDQVARTRGARKGADRTTRIEVTIDAATGRMSVFNDGPGIPWTTHLKTGRPLVETLFGTIYSSSNYRDDEDRFTGGCNGMGAFLTNVWSTRFEVETRAAVTPKDAVPAGVKKRPRPKSIVYEQAWSRNSRDVGEPRCRADYETKAGYTRVTFTPDWARLGLEGPTVGLLAAWARRVIDVAGTTPPDVVVTLNGAEPPVQGFEAYTRALYAHYGGDPAAVAVQTLKTAKGDPWEAAVVPAPGPARARRGAAGVPRSVSFVNGVATVAGGTHVSHLLDLVGAGLAKRAKAGSEGGGGGGAVPTGDHVKSAAMVFLRASVPTPSFGHQTKDTLNTPRAKLAAVLPKVGDAALRGLATDAMLEAVRTRAAADAAAALSAASRKTGSTGVTTASAARRIAELAPNYSGASLAGTKRARECRLFLSEGLSAKTMIMGGISEVGRDRHGVFPLKGVPLNAATATSADLAKNAELSALVAVLGLVYGREYDASLRGLRYGGIVLMMDQDHDGSHIKGLILEFFRTHWPSLFAVKGFIQEFVTPIVRVRAATAKARAEPGPAVRSFYALPDFEAWVAARGPAGAAGWNVKYYKGLGSSRREEGCEYMRARDEHCYRVTADAAADFAALDMAFAKGDEAVRARRE